MAHERRVLIAGGGIGGLAAAIALASRDHGPAVLERSGFSEESGAGIQLGPNATRALARLGVLAEIEPLAFRPEAIWIFDGLTGRRIGSVPLGRQAEARYGAPYLTLHRADLHAGLLAACRRLSAIELHSGFEIASLEAQAGMVEARSSSGGAVAGACLIGADGLWSTVRKTVAPRRQLCFAGATAARTVMPRAGLPAPFTAPVVGLWLGPHAHLVHYPVRGGKELNLVAVTAGGSERAGWDRSADRQALLSTFARWCNESKSLLERAGSWRSWSLYRLAPLSRWSAGSITLLGDAAHPVLPFLAQGAALALEDAVTVAASIHAHPHDPALAFHRYEALRRPRATRVQRLSARFGWLYHLGGPLRLARNLVLEARDQTRALERFDWLYGETADS